MKTHLKSVVLQEKNQSKAILSIGKSSLVAFRAILHHIGDALYRTYLRRAKGSEEERLVADFTSVFSHKEAPLLRIEKGHAEEMIAHALEEDPNECCGILAGKDGQVMKLYRITNTEKSPYRYRMEPLEQLQADRDTERNGWEFLAFYHSHTHSPAIPSSTDIRMALDSGWLNVYYVLVSLMNKADPAIRAFRITPEGEVTEEELRVDE